MKQLDFETSNYKHKEEIKTFVSGFNEMVDKYVKTFDNADADLKRANAGIEKKNASLGKLDAVLADLNKKTDELKSLKELSSEEIKSLEEKKGAISFTDSEVQKMELEDINAQISAKKGKISKIDAKLDATKAKIKTSNDERKTCEKELKELDKQRVQEEEALYRTETLLSLIRETKEMINSQVIDIINAPYSPVVETEEEIEEEVEVAKEPKTSLDDLLGAEEMVLPTSNARDILGITEEDLSKDDDEEISVHDAVVEIDDVEIPASNEEEEDEGNTDSALEELFEKEGIDFKTFSSKVREKMISKKEEVIKNLEILKKHNVPLEYTKDQSEIFYDISSQDLDDLLSIITTDEDGNGMGFSIDFTYNVLSELSKINVDRLIDVYNNEFMNVNAKSGIIYLLKLTNPGLVNFEKNRRTNVEILKSLGTKTVDEIVSKHPEFVDMDNPLFINVLNVFDKNDLVEKLNNDVDVIPKIIEYWKNN